MIDPIPADTNKISALYESATVVTGECTTGATVYIFDATSNAILRTVSCTGGTFDTTLDFSTYPEGAVTIKLTQGIGSNYSSSQVTLALTKETTYCKDGANLAGVPNGTGASALDPFMICTMAQLSATFDSPNDNSYFRFRNDVNATGDATFVNRYGAGGAGVNIDGSGFGIYNYTNAGTIAGTIGGTIQDLKLRNVNATVTPPGGFSQFGLLTNSAGILNRVSLRGTITYNDPGSGSSNGGLVGVLNTSMTGTWVNATLTSTNAMGGNIAGLVGSMPNGGTVTGCWSKGTFSGTGFHSAAGLVTSIANSLTMSSSWSKATISAEVVAGGLIQGLNAGTHTITSSYYSGTLSTVSNEAAMIGVTNSPTSLTISDSYVTGQVNGADIGGFIGLSTAGGATTVNIIRSYSKAAINATRFAGGLVGWLNNTTLTVTDSYALGDVTTTGAASVGGHVGEIVASTYNCNTSYYSGVVTRAAGPENGIASAGTSNNCYWDQDQEPASTIGTGLTTAQMSSAANFTGFTFDATHWVMGAQSTPMLYWE